VAQNNSYIICKFLAWLEALGQSFTLPAQHRHTLSANPIPSVLPAHRLSSPALRPPQSGIDSSPAFCPPPAGPAASLRPLRAYSLPLPTAAATPTLAPAIAFGRQSEAPGAWPATAAQPAVAPDARPWPTSTQQQASDPASPSRRLFSAVRQFRFNLRCGLYACLRL
jgi:hypothetical protein